MLLLTIIGALLGASLASFSGLVLERHPRGMSCITPRSACATCGSGIAWHDNIPVLSFLALRGSCGSCRASIPKRLFTLEVAGASAGAAVTYAVLRQYF